LRGSLYIRYNDLRSERAIPTDCVQFLSGFRTVKVTNAK